VRHPKTVEQFEKEGGVFQPKTEGCAAILFYCTAAHVSSSAAPCMHAGQTLCWAAAAC
jgi:hypothetical protein